MLVEADENDFIEATIDQLHSLQISGQSIPQATDIEEKYQTYDCKVDPTEGDRSYEINFYSIKRPHMRAFWFSNICNRMSVLLWFSVNPLLHIIQESLSLTKEELWSSMIATFVGSLITRLIAGPICDKFGARLPFAFFILATCIPTILCGFIRSSFEFIIVRFFLGIGGGAFVMCHMWLEAMFTKSYSGFLHGFAGSIGGVVGLTQMSIGTIVFPLATKITGSTEMGWRLSFVPPVVMAIIVAFFTILFTDDTPKGNISKLKQSEKTNYVSVKESLKAATGCKNVWLIACQYACNFGIEIVLYSLLGFYFQDQYKIGLVASSSIIGVAGGMNQILRMIGGKISDTAYESNGVQGRITWQSRFIFLSGLFFIPFASAQTLYMACLWLFVAMAFLSFSQSATFGLLGVVGVRGAAMGVIGASGNIGAIIVAIIFRQLSYKNAFELVAIVTMLSALLSFFLDFPDRPGFKCFGKKCKNEISSQQTDETESDLESLEKSDASEKSSVSSNKLCSPEIGMKMMEGWTLVLDSYCTSCAVPKLSPPHASDPMCVLCNHYLSNNQSNVMLHIREKGTKDYFDEISLSNPHVTNDGYKAYKGNHFDYQMRVSSSKSDMGPQIEERKTPNKHRRIRSLFSLTDAKHNATDDFAEAIQQEHDP